MTGGYIDIVAVRHDSAAPAGQTTVVRLLGLLPAQWSCAPEAGPDRITLRIALGGATDSGAVHRAVTRVLADAALRGWARER